MGSHIATQTGARSSTEMADNVELKEAFKLFDMDGDGMITKDELRKLVEKVGGSMTEGEAKGLIHQADKDGNESIDFSEFSKLWAAIKGEGEGEKEIRKEFGKLDVDNSGRVSYPEFLLVWKYKSH